MLPVRNCRLVKYEHLNEAMDRSYDFVEDENTLFTSLLGGSAALSVCADVASVRC